MRILFCMKTGLLALVVFLVCIFSAGIVPAQMDWTELEPDAATASRKDFLAKTTQLDTLIETGQYIQAVEYAYGEAASLPKEYRKKSVDNAIREIKQSYDSGQRAEATLEIMDLAIRFSQVQVLKRARNQFFASLVADWQNDVRVGNSQIQRPQEANGNMCVLARGLISWGRRNFKKHPQRGLAGMELARLYCPEAADIAYNLGLAQYRIGQKEVAQKTWADMAPIRPWDSVLLSNLGWLALELGDVDQADHYAMQTLAADPQSPNGLAIRLEVLFARGQYKNAVQTVFANERQTTPRYEKRAVDYAVAVEWERFKSSNKEEALLAMEDLAEEFPQAEPFVLAAKAMKTALDGQPAKIPPSETLPHLRKPGEPIYPPDHGITFDPLSIGQGPEFHRKGDAAFALVAGIKEYKHMLGPAHAEKDAQLFQDLLTGYMGFPQDRANIRLHLGKLAMSRSLREGIAWLARNAALNQNALIILYFSGKGAPVFGNDKRTITDCLLIPYDADPDHPENGLPISLTEIKEAFAASGNPNIQIILDAGFLGDGKSIGLGRGLIPVALQDLFQSQAAIVTAAGVTREALEFQPGKQGAFSYFYFDALMGKGDLDEDGWVDSSEAFTWAANAMKDQGVVQKPGSNQKPPLKLSKVQ
ncbi:MAG: caspase family protein [Desulfatibacillum sp.]|nr:caspase family protein [Desulfatibacillum sp.]